MSTWVSRVPVVVSLRRLFPLASFVGCADIRVSDATEVSSECRRGVLFAAIRGTQFDGSKFVGEAIAAGASALLVDRPLADVSVPQCVIGDVRRAYAELCAALAGWPSRRMNIVGVTGTNGKTTVTWLVRSILASHGQRAGVLGTIEYCDGLRLERASLTTPDSRSVSRWLAGMVQNGLAHAAIELSSHALAQGRTVGTNLASAIVTNITQDHFDYHRDYQRYMDAKAEIVRYCRPGGPVFLNVDDDGSRSLVERLTGRANVITYGLDRPADVSAVVLDESLNGSRFEMRLAGGPVEVRTPLVGRYNISNCLAAAAACEHLGVPGEAIARGIESLTSVPGRLERVDCGQPFDVFVDYAHTDDALRRCVTHLRELTHGRVICVFGAGGDRDRLKRPLLGRAAAAADIAVVTSDNPRTEDPNEIIREVLEGCQGASCRPWVEVDRAEAIQWALSEARPGDCVLVAGKGHEVEQIIGTQRLPFDDREVVRRSLVAMSISNNAAKVKVQV